MWRCAQQVCGSVVVWRPVLLRQPEDGQYRPKHVVVHLAIKYTQLCLTIYNFQVSHTHNGDDTLPRYGFELSVTVQLKCDGTRDGK